MKLIILGAFSIFFVACSSVTPLEYHYYYAQNYPKLQAPTAQQTGADAGIAKLEVPLDDSSGAEIEPDQAAAEPQLELAQENASDQDQVAADHLSETELAPAAPTPENEDNLPTLNSAADEDTTANLNLNQTTASNTNTNADFLAASVKSFSDQDISTEEKILSAAFVAFNERNYIKFEALTNEFLASYPDSQYANRIKGLKEEFYYNYTFSVDLMKDQIIEMSSLDYLSWVEFKNYINELNIYSIDAFIFSPFQNFNEIKIPFLTQHSLIGANFNSQTLPVVNDALGELGQILADEKIDFLVKLPIRSYDNLDLTKSGLMDQAYDNAQNRFNYNFKLNIFHPEAQNYLRDIVDELAKYDISGIVLKADYELEFNEGYSEFNQIVYQTETKQKILPQDIPVAYWRGDFKTAASTDSRYAAFHNYRINKLHLTLLNLVRYIRSRYPILKIGIEVNPELITQAEESLVKYSVNAEQIVNIGADFIIINSIIPPDFAGYKSAFDLLSEINENKIPLMLRLEYPKSGLEEYSRSLSAVRSIAPDAEHNKIILGPNVTPQNWSILLEN